MTRSIKFGVANLNVDIFRPTYLWERLFLRDAPPYDSYCTSSSHLFGMNQVILSFLSQVSVSENTVLTRGELLQNSMRVACYMRSLHIHQSDIVGIVARNTTHLSAVAYGCFLNGIPFHALHINYGEEVRKLFALSNPRLIFRFEHNHRYNAQPSRRNRYH